MSISSSNPEFDNLYEPFNRDDSNMGISEEVTQVELIEVNFMHLIWSTALRQSRQLTWLCVGLLKGGETGAVLVDRVHLEVVAEVCLQFIQHDKCLSRVPLQ